MLEQMAAEREAKPTPEQMREAVEHGIDQAINELVRPYTQGAPLDIVGDVLVDRLDQLLTSKQMDSFMESMALGTQKMYDKYIARGFSPDHAVQLLCAALSKGSKK
jgi:hypothetical protein